MNVTAPGPAQDLRPIRRALCPSTTRPAWRSWRRGLHAAGVADRLHRLDRGPDRRPPASRSPRWRSSPASPSAWTAGSRRCTRGCTPGSSPTCAGPTTWPSSTSWASRRSTSSWSTSTRSPRPWPPGPRRTSASSRSTSAAPRWCAPPRRTTPASPSSPTRRATPTCSPRSQPAASPWPSGARLAAEAFEHTAAYDVAVASWMGNVAPRRRCDGDRLPGAGSAATWERARVLRYGENPHQGAALYTGGGRAPGSPRPSSCTARRCRYNNYVDADAARRAALRPRRPAVAVIKHANPCGIAVGADVAEAHAKAHACDPVSAFGGVIAANRTVTAAMAEQVAEIFTEVVVAPDFEPEALEILTRKKNIRLLRCAGPATPAPVEMPPGQRRPAAAGRRPHRRRRRRPGAWTLAAGSRPTRPPWPTWSSPGGRCRAVKSNAILLAKDGASVGVGMGQVNRVDACRLAVARAGAERAARLGRRLGRVLPVPRRPAGAHRRRGARRRPAGRLGA